MLNINAPETLTILKVHGSSGNLKINKSDLLTVVFSSSSVTQKITCDRKCIVTFKCSEGEVKQKDDLLCVLSPCTHEIVVSGFCGLCSMPVEIQNFGNGELKCSTGSRLAILHSNKNVVVKKEAAIKISLKDYVGLLKKRKLSLLVDLDSTILHSTDKNIGNNFEEVYSYTMKADQNNSILLNYHTKFRPYLKKFLTEMNEIYEMHIYTFGNKFYAEKIAEFIDPEKRFFGQRIISKDDSFDPMKKSANLKSLFPRGDNMVCIIDDRTDVWNNAPNCIHVQPYLFFPETGDINDPYKVGQCQQNLVKKSNIDNDRIHPLNIHATKDEEVKNQIENNIDTKSDDDDLKNSEIGKVKAEINDVKENENQECNNKKVSQKQDLDCYLLSLANILKEIHNRFYTEIDKLLESQTVLEIIENNNLPDVKQLMTQMRSQVLSGCRVSFSGLIPLNQKVKDTYEYHMLTSLGGEYLHNVSLPSLRLKENPNQESTTHLVCKSEGTKKMKQVAQYITEVNRLITDKPEKLPPTVHSVHLVRHDWLWQSFFFWQKVSEEDFIFLPQLKQLPVPENFLQNQSDQISNNNFKMPKKRKSPVIDQLNTPCKISRNDSDNDDVIVPINEEDLKDLDGIDNESLSGISTNSLDESVDSYNDKDVPLDNLILHYSLQEQMDMFNEVDEAMDEEKCEKLRSPESSDYYNSDSSSSSDKSDSESDDFQKPPKNWEKSNDSNSNNSNDEHEIDYADLEESCNDFGLVKDNVKSDFDDIFDDCNF